MNTPDILFLDEPTTGLDPQTRKQVWESIERLRHERNMTVFLTTHQQLEMIWNFHHILADGWSMPVIFGDFQKYYEMLLYGEDINYRVSNSYERYVNRIYSRDILKGSIGADDSTFVLL